MPHIIVEFGLAIVSSLIASLLMVRANRRLQRSWRVFFLSFGLALVAAALLIIWRANRSPNSSLLASSGSASNSVATEADRRRTELPPATDGGRSATEESPTPEASFIKTFLAVPAGGSAKATNWAVVLRNGDGLAQSQLTEAIAETLSSKSYKVVPVFRPDIYYDPGFRQLFNADSSLLQKLGGSCAGVFVGEVKEASSTDDSMQGLVTTRLTLDARVFLTDPAILKTAFQISEKGGGFSQSTSQAQAGERLAQKLRERLLRELQ